MGVRWNTAQVKECLACSYVMKDYKWLGELGQFHIQTEHYRLTNKCKPSSYYSHNITSCQGSYVIPRARFSFFKVLVTSQLLLLKIHTDYFGAPALLS